jgi:hypothetical protein
MRFISVGVRTSFLAFLTAATFLTLTTTAEAQRNKRPKSQFHVGQKVECEFLGKVRLGEVVSINNLGWVKVRFTDNGQERTWDFPPDNIWLPKKTTKPATPGQAKPPLRTWTDSTGLFKIDARFVELKDGKVTLEKDDGSKKTLPLDKLSDEDQQAVKEFAAKKTPPQNPFEGSDDSGPSTKGQDAEPANDEDIIAPDGDWTSVRDVVVDVSLKGQFAPDAAEGERLESMRTVMLDVTKGAADRDFAREKMAGFFVDRQRQRLVVASTNDELRGGRRGARVEACDLRSGKSLGAIVLDTAIIPCDLSPDGSSIACMPAELVSAFHKRRGIEVWRMDAGGKLAKRWNPNDTRGKEEMFRVDRAMFISRDRLLTVNTWGGKATVWDIDKAQAVYSLAIDQHSRPALSANRKQLAVLCSGIVGVLDAATGQTLMALTGASHAPRKAAPRRGAVRFGARFAFRSDGCQLAVLDSEVLQIWDLQKQTLLEETWLPQSPDLVEWVDKDHLLVNGGDLIDIRKRIVLWHYEVPGQVKSVGNVVNGHLAFGYSQSEGGRNGLHAGVFFLALPHPEAAQVGAGLADEKLLVLKPGAQVALDIRVPAPTPQDTEGLNAAYAEQLKAREITVAAGSPLTFQATVEAGKTQSQTYHSIGRLGADETATFTTQKCRLALMENGKVLWERKADIGGAPMMVSHSADESLQAAVDRQSQQTVLAFFRNISLPGYLARQGEHGAYGFSKVTPMGPIAYEPGK